MICRLLFACICCIFLQVSYAQIQSFPLADVELLSSPFKQAQETDKRYILSLNPDRLLAPFLKEAGLPTKADNYGNWENTGLDGHIGGHYLSALAYMYAATKDKEILARLNYMLTELGRCQVAGKTGYIGGTPGGKVMWEEIKQGKIKAESFALNSKWVPLYNIHKLFAGLIDAYSIAGIEETKPILIQLSSWFYNTMQGLTDPQIQDMLKSEHGGMNEALLDVHMISQDQKYLKLAKRFSHRALLDPMMAKQDVLTKLHANMQIPKVVGFARIGSFEQNKDWIKGAQFFWENVTQHRSISIGGNSVSEHFHPSTDFSTMLTSREGPETCNSYNMLKLTKQLFLQSQRANYIDFYERTVYNHILSSQHPDGGFVYFTAARPGHYKVYSSSQESFWCCVGSGMENHGKYGELIYAYASNAIYVNLFIPSIVRWKEKGLTITQQNTFPENTSTMLTISTTKPIDLTVSIRCPEWLSITKMEVEVNGKPVSVVQEDGYVSIKRQWKNGDKIHVPLPMKTMLDHLPDASSWVSIRKGPWVMAATWQDTTALKGVKADGSRMGHVAHGKLIPLTQLPLVIDSSINVQTIKAAYIDGRTTELPLKPFYQIHDVRYILYWYMNDRQDLEKASIDIKKLDQLK